MSARPIGRLALGASAIAIVAAIAVAVWVMGSPAEQRLLHLDERREHDLQRIAGSVHVYAQAQRALPPDLAALTRQPGPAPAPRDPETAQPYAYRLLDATHFELCADFALASRDPAWSPDETWHHAAGHQCFRRESAIAPSAPPSGIPFIQSDSP